VEGLVIGKGPIDAPAFESLNISDTALHSALLKPGAIAVGVPQESP
jgi:hypothetical protein